MSYDFIDQDVISSTLIQGHTNDSFYFPISNQHTGYAADGTFYSLGAPVSGHQQASWFTEFATNTVTRGNQAAFPTYGLVLLSPVSLVILNQAIQVTNASDLPLWMQFLLSDNNAFTNNFNGSVQGFTPSGVCYADGKLSITYAPDPGNQANGLTHPVLPPFPSPYPTVPITSQMSVTVDFVQDSVYLDVGV